MTNLTKKIVAIVTTVTCAVWMMGPGVANALTAAELQALIDDLLAQIADLQTQLAELEGETPAVSGCLVSSFDRNLQVGMTGDDVNCLQIVLNSASDTKLADSGVGSPGNETSYFGPLTKAGVIKFQEKYADDVLASWGLTSGTGFVGSTTRAKLNEILSAGVSEEEEEEEEEEVSTGTASVSLAATTPEASQVALAAQDAIVTKVKFAGGDEGVTITKILVKRGGIAADTDVSSVKLYDGTKQLGSTQALNTNTHKATFTSLNWEIPAGQVKYLAIKVSIAAKGTATVGDSIKMGIVQASDITSTGTLEGTFPIYGNALTIAGISVGELFVEAQSTPATTTILSGAVEQELASWKFTASSTEAVEIHSIKITHTGSAATGDLANLKLKLSGVQIGSTIASLDSGSSATFDLSNAPISILASGSKTVYAYADIASGIWTARTVILEITQYTDVVVYGANSGGSITPANSDTAAFAKQTGCTMTIGQGSLTINIDGSLNPASQSYVKGSTQRLFSAFKFTTGSREGVRVVKLKLHEEGPGTATDISNVTLWDGSTQIAGPASLIGSYVTFGANTIGFDDPGLFDIPKGFSKTIQVKADIPSGATAQANAVDLDIDAYTDIWIDGLESQYDIDQTASNIVLSSGDANRHTISANGTLTLSKSSNTPAAQTYIKGSNEKEFLRLNLAADSGEDMSVSAMTIDIWRGDTGSADTAASGDLTNVKLLKADGTQVGSTVSSPTTEAAFSFSLTIPAAETVALRVVADIPQNTNATSGGIYMSIEDNTHIDSEGVASAATITESGMSSAIDGNVMAIGEGELTVTASAIPGDQTKIIGATDVEMVRLLFTAGAAEDIRVTKVKLIGCDASHGYDGNQDNLDHIALYDGSTILTTKKGWDSSTATTVTFTASDFLNSQGFDISKGQQKAISVKADIVSTGVNGETIALGIASSTGNRDSVLNDFDQPTTTDIVFVGLESNSTPATKITYSNELWGVNFSTSGESVVNYVTLNEQGALTVDVAADTPDIAILAIGGPTDGLNDVVFLKATFEAELEDIDITDLEIERNFGTSTYDNLYKNISLWDGSTQLGNAQALVNSIALGNSSTTFNLPVTGYWRIPAGEIKTLTVKANLNGTLSDYIAGVWSGNASKLCLAGLTNDQLKVNGVGVSSGKLISASSTTAVLNDACGNEMIPYKSKPTIAAASLPSTVYNAGEKVLYRWTVTADGAGDIGWNRVVFDVSGSVTISGTSYNIGLGDVSDADDDNSLRLGTSTTPANNTPDIELVVATSSVKIYNVATAQQVTASSGSAWTSIENINTVGGARIIFTPSAEQLVAKGTTKTYELRADLAYGGAAGDSISTKIAQRATATTTGTFYYVAIAHEATTTDLARESSRAKIYFATSSEATFIWTDRSGGGGTHKKITNDWTYDYKISGLPTATLSLSK